ncbi:hypothetical protein, partial [Parablautia intestinalis]|uniref:hypothetical protein n=1 Tax=Parablautia intestinalis TaxID=2320100 RepID=UPI00256EDA00
SINYLNGGNNLINIGDIVNFVYGKNNYCGRVVIFVPKKIDAFEFREKYKEVKDSNCNFCFVEDYDRVVVVVPTGKRNSVFKAYAPAVSTVKKEDDLRSYRVQGYMNGKMIEGEFNGTSIIDAIRSAEELGYKDIVSGK